MKRSDVRSRLHLLALLPGLTIGGIAAANVDSSRPVRALIFVGIAVALFLAIHLLGWLINR
jgi:hypothetical protein